MRSAAPKLERAFQNVRGAGVKKSRASTSRGLPSPKLSRSGNLRGTKVWRFAVGKLWEYALSLAGCGLTRPYRPNKTHPSVAVASQPGNLPLKSRLHRLGGAKPRGLALGNNKQQSRYLSPPSPAFLGPPGGPFSRTGRAPSAPPIALPRLRRL